MEFSPIEEAAAVTEEVEAAAGAVEEAVVAMQVVAGHLDLRSAKGMNRSIEPTRCLRGTITS